MEEIEKLAYFNEVQINEGKDQAVNSEERNTQPGQEELETTNACLVHEVKIEDSTMNEERAAIDGLLLSHLRDLQEEMQRLRTDFDTKLKYDASKGQLIDSLHSELQDYRAGLHFKILRPLFIDLIAMYDDLCKLIENPKIQDEQKHSLPLFHSFLESIEEILHRNGVEAFQNDEPTFVANRQRVLKVIGTPDVTQDKQIARRVRKGFLYDEKLLRPELVDTYKFDPSLREEA